ncbi:MAG: efflux RND transporter permease subunit [Gallionella sp.]|nr:efflux RND transporter permease subunit [Gallionella sp.]MDD4958173.1 efflux RND transporter permease subunit [Gallionella sp.]
MQDFNLSNWAIKNAALVRYALVVLLLAGLFSYTQLAQKEDPDFTFKVMSIQLNWPGATAREVEQQITQPLETRLQETPWLDAVSSYSKAGEAILFITLKESMPSSALSPSWAQVRRILSDAHASLPDNVSDPLINDHFGETFGLIYALTSDTLSHAALANVAREVRERLVKVANVNKVQLLGVQDEKIYIEFSSQKMAEASLDPLQVSAALRAQNALEPAGELLSENGVARVRVSGDFQSVQSIQDIGIAAGGKIHRLGDISRVYRDVADPAVFKVRSMGNAAIALAISLSEDGNINQIGADMAAEWARITPTLPKGVTMVQVADQPAVVKQSISDFMRALFEALAIVLAVSFLSLGMRAGLVVGLSIPLVLAGTFWLMYVFGIDLQRVSLGALIIALGLLVDDAMIAVEMMKVKLEQGFSKLHAATFAYTSTAFPMLTGTLITAAAFLPVGLAKSSAGEYTFSICAVVTIALLVSWLVAVVFTPFIGHRLLHETSLPEPNNEHYQQGFYAYFRRVVVWCLDYKKTVVAVTVLLFALALFGFSKVEQEFFPPSERAELLMDIWLPEGVRFSTTEALTQELESKLKNDTDIRSYTSYIGGSTPRFYLPLDLQLSNVNFAQMVIVAKDNTAREAVLKRVRALLDKDYAELGIRISRLENGPPVGYPVQFRVVGTDIDELRRIADSVLSVVKQNKQVKNASVDASNKVRVVKVEVNQEAARTLGLSSQTIARNLHALLSGFSVSYLREAGQRTEIIARATADERNNPEYLGRLPVHVGQGKFVLLSQVATVTEAEENGLIWRMNRQPVVTVRADVPDDVRAPDVSAAIEKQLANVRANLPAGYRIELGGAAEGSDNAQASIVAVLPLMGFLIVTLLMLQLKSVNLTVLALMTAPLGIIGVTAALLMFHVPFGFVAMLGIISLAGMIMRNSVILLDQITQDIAAGLSQWEAVVDSTVRRFRPIMLTAAAAILAMIPLTRSVFWGPMAIAIMGGLLIATLLTLLYLPALYAVWFGVEKPKN